VKRASTARPLSRTGSPVAGSQAGQYAPSRTRPSSTSSGSHTCVAADAWCGKDQRSPRYIGTTSRPRRTRATNEHWELCVSVPGGARSPAFRHGPSTDGAVSTSLSLRSQEVLLERIRWYPPSVRHMAGDSPPGASASATFSCADR
jgi:hypothetical protein